MSSAATVSYTHLDVYKRQAVGYPDLSYHCKNAWIGECDATKLCVGVMYCGDYNEVNKDYVYVACLLYTSDKRIVRAIIYQNEMKEPQIVPVTDQCAYFELFSKDVYKRQR